MYLSYYHSSPMYVQKAKSTLPVGAGSVEVLNFKKESLNVSLPWREAENESWGFWVIWSIFNIILKITLGFSFVTLWNFTHFQILRHVFETSSLLSFREDTRSSQRNGTLNRYYFYICTSNKVHLLANFEELPWIITTKLTAMNGVVLRVASVSCHVCSFKKFIN